MHALASAHAEHVLAERKLILSLDLSRSRPGAGGGWGKPCPHGQGWGGWGIRQRGNGRPNLTRSGCLSPHKPPSLRLGGACGGIEGTGSRDPCCPCGVRAWCGRLHSASGGSRAVTAPL